MDENFFKFISVYEMAKMDALKASLMKVRELLDNEPSKEIHFDQTDITLNEFDNRCDFGHHLTSTIFINENGELCVLDDCDNEISIDKVDANSIINIVSKIVLDMN